MPDNTYQLSNAQARALWLHCHRLLQSPFPSAEHHRISESVTALGMVQLDPIGVLARAHEHILWSRHGSFRTPDFHRLYQQNRAVFEHFSHDAAILPLKAWPYWQLQMQRKSQQFKNSRWGAHMAGTRTRSAMIEALEKNGPMCSQEFTRNHAAKADKTAHAWMKPPHKLALDYLWLAGQLSVSHRHGFIKYYDLSERIITQDLREQKISRQEQIDWLCTNALQRLGFASSLEIQRFYDTCTTAEVERWLAGNRHRVQTIRVETATGQSIKAYACKSIEQLVSALPRASGRVRIVNPFDPVIRDRKRLKRLFGFDYRIEIYVPAGKRQYGYYVCPILEGTRFTGRIEVRADRNRDTLVTQGYWLENGINESRGRLNRLRAELNRLASLVGVSRVEELPSPVRAIL